MEVKLLAHTIDPAGTVAVAGKGCYSPMPASDIVLDPKDVEHTLGVIHPSCYEHAVFTFSISGISRATSHQLVRHRMASYSQQSQRYVKPKDLDSETMAFEYVIPETIPKDIVSGYQKVMESLNRAYIRLLRLGIPEEDARYILPNACTTNIVVTMNARELQHFCGLRRCSRAQWEIRELADRMAQAAEEACPELFKHFSLGPQCEQLGYCPEHKGCGRKQSLDAILRYEKGILIMPDLTDEQLGEMKEKVIAAMESTHAVPIIALPTDTRESRVTDKTRTAEEYREDGYEDLAKQKEGDE